MVTPTPRLDCILWLNYTPWPDHTLWWYLHPGPTLYYGWPTPRLDRVLWWQFHTQAGPYIMATPCSLAWPPLAHKIRPIVNHRWPYNVGSLCVHSASTAETVLQDNRNMSSWGHNLIDMDHTHSPLSKFPAYHADSPSDTGDHWPQQHIWHTGNIDLSVVPTMAWKWTDGPVHCQYIYICAVGPRAWIARE